MITSAFTAKYLNSPEWTDDQKANVLFAPFREKSLNPHSWERKLNFWTDAVLECAQVNNILLLDLKTLPTYFERHGKYPKCLQTVAEQMLRACKLQSLEDFKHQSNSWTGWSFENFVRKPLTWGASWILPSHKDVFVIVDQVKVKCTELLEHHYQQAQHSVFDNLVELSVFRSRCLQLVQSQEECDLVLKQLELDHRIVITKDKHGTEIVKIAKKGEGKVQPVQVMELNILRIRNVMKNLEQQIEALSAQCDVHTAEAQKMVRYNRKALALHQLRKRKTVQRQIDKKTSCAFTLHDIIQKIEDSSSNEMVVQAYESGVDTIRKMTGDLNMEKVDKVLDDLHQVFEDQEEINQAIADVSLPGSEVNLDDLDLELSLILAEMEEGGDKKVEGELKDHKEGAVISGLSVVDALPDVPVTPPGEGKRTSSPLKQQEPAV